MNFYEKFPDMTLKEYAKFTESLNSWDVSLQLYRGSFNGSQSIEDFNKDIDGHKDYVWVSQEQLDLALKNNIMWHFSFERDDGHYANIMGHDLEKTMNKIIESFKGS